MEIVTLFKDFGYPALISAFLLWIYITKLEKIVLMTQRISDLVLEIKITVEKNKEIVTELREVVRQKEAADDHRRDNKSTT